MHLCDYPEFEAGFAKPALELAVARMRQVILLGRQQREEAKIGLRTPLRSLKIIHRDPDLLAEIAKLGAYVKAELNVQELTFDTDEGRYVDLVAKPKFRVLGKRLGKRLQVFAPLINALSARQIADLQEEGALEVQGERFTLEEIEVRQQPLAGSGAATDGAISIVLDTALTEDLVRGGYAREIVNRVQRVRKDRGLAVSDRIVLRFDGADALLQASDQHRDYIMGETLCTTFERVALAQEDGQVAVEVDGMAFRFTVTKAVYHQ